MDKEAIEDIVRGTNIFEIDFYIDGRKLCRWIRQGDGSWSGLGKIFAEPDRLKQPNLNPITLKLQSVRGTFLEEWDFANFGLSEDVLLFDLDRERMVNTGYEKIESNRHYAIVCDRKYKVLGCELVQTFERNNINRKAVRLPSCLNQNLCVIYEDFVLWQPVRDEIDEIPHFSLILTTPTTDTLSLNDRTKLKLTGLPEDAEDVRLLVHKKIYELARCAEGWITQKEITITPELATRQRRVKVRFIMENKRSTQEPRLVLNLLGAAMYRYHQDDNSRISFDVLKEGMNLNRSEGTTNIKIWTPSEGKETIVLEGMCQVARFRQNKTRLLDFPGHGGQLNVVSDGKRYDLGVRCIDRGCVHSYLPSLLGRDAQMSFLSEKHPDEAGDDGYLIYIWFISENNKGKFKRIPVTSILPTSSCLIWKVRDSSNPMATALTWKGHWLGAWWKCDLIRDYFIMRSDLSEHDFAITKWLRVPVLLPSLSSTFKQAVLNTPCRFLKTWLHDNSIPDGIKPHDHIEGLDSVVRHFLWNDFPVLHTKEAIELVKQWTIKVSRDHYDVNHLLTLSNLSPILLWKGMEDKLKQNCQTIIPILHAFTREQFGLFGINSEQKMQNRIEELKKQVIKTTGLEEKRLKKVVQDRITGMHENRWQPSDQDCNDLLRIGETDSGRRYLSTQIGLYWINLSRR